MSIVYFDASALVKLLVEEEGSSTVAQLWDACDAAVSSRLAHPEVCAALAAGRRNHDLDDATHRAVLRRWADHRAALRPVEFTAAVERRGGELAAERSLRGADAVHLASASVVGRDDVILAVWDRRLHRAAIDEGFAVAPAELPGPGR